MWSYYKLYCSNGLIVYTRLIIQIITYKNDNIGSNNRNACFFCKNSSILHVKPATSILELNKEIVLLKIHIETNIPVFLYIKHKVESIPVLPFIVHENLIPISLWSISITSNNYEVSVHCDWVCHFSPLLAALWKWMSLFTLQCYIHLQQRMKHLKETQIKNMNYID